MTIFGLPLYVFTHYSYEGFQRTERDHTIVEKNDHAVLRELISAMEVILSILMRSGTVLA